MIEPFSSCEIGKTSGTNKKSKQTNKQKLKFSISTTRLPTTSPAYAYAYAVECSEKTKSFNLKIPQPDSERRHSPDFKTVFEIMIGPFSFCEIGKT